MKKNFYIFTSGKLRRKDNTICFEPFATQLDENEQKKLCDSDFNIDEEFLIQYDESEEETLTIERKYIPIETIDSIYCFGELRFNSKFFNFLSQNNIPLHLFNYHGFYSGTFYPRETQASGKLLISQVSSYLDERKRLEIAKEFIRGAVHNIIKNLEYYNNREKKLDEYIQYANEAKHKIEEAKTIEELMGIEGRN